MKFKEVKERNYGKYVFVKPIPETDEEKYFLKLLNEDEYDDLDEDLKLSFRNGLLDSVLDYTPEYVVNDFPKDLIFQIKIA